MEQILAEERADVRGQTSIALIVDVDVARETAALTKNNILQQSALSILAQANSQPAIALSLL